MPLAKRQILQHVGACNKAYKVIKLQRVNLNPGTFWSRYESATSMIPYMFPGDFYFVIRYSWYVFLYHWVLSTMIDKVCLFVSNESAFWYDSENASRYILSTSLQDLSWPTDSTDFKVFIVSHSSDTLSDTVASSTAETPALDAWMRLERSLSSSHGFPPFHLQ